MSRFVTPGRLLGLLALLIVGGVGYWWYHATRPDYRLKQGVEAAKGGDFLRAQQYASLLESSAGAEDHVRLLRGEIAFWQNKPLDALEQVQLMSAKSPLRVPAALLAARSLISIHRPREAEQPLQFVLDEDPDQVDAHRLLGQIYYDQGDYSRALPQMELVAGLDPKDPLPHRNIGRMYRDMEDQDKAVAAYEVSLQRNEQSTRRKDANRILPDEADVRIELATCLLKQFKDAEAIKALGSLDVPEAVVVRSEALIGLGKESEAIDALEASLVKYPEDGGLLRLRGERYNAAGKPEQAAKLLERAMEKDPQDYRGRSQLATAYENMGRSAEAKVHREKALATQKIIEEIDEKSKEAMRNPWDPKPRYRLAELCEKMGRTEQVKFWEQAAKACDPAARR